MLESAANELTMMSYTSRSDRNSIRHHHSHESIHNHHDHKIYKKMSQAKPLALLLYSKSEHFTLPYRGRIKSTGRDSDDGIGLSQYSHSSTLQPCKETNVYSGFRVFVGLRVLGLR